MKSLKVSDQIPTSALQKMLELKGKSAQFLRFESAAPDVVRHTYKRQCPLLTTSYLQLCRCD